MMAQRTTIRDIGAEHRAAAFRPEPAPAANDDHQPSTVGEFYDVLSEMAAHFRVRASLAPHERALLARADDVLDRADI